MVVSNVQSTGFDITSLVFSSNSVQLSSNNTVPAQAEPANDTEYESQNPENLGTIVDETV